MAARPGGRRYNSELRIITGLDKLNQSKRGLQSLNRLMLGLIGTGTKVQSFTEQLHTDIKRSGVESNVYLSGLKDINTQADALRDIYKKMADGEDPLTLDKEQFDLYLGMVEQAADLRNILEEMTEEQQKIYGIGEEQFETLDQIKNEYTKIKDQVAITSDVLTDLQYIQEDIAEMGKQWGVIFKAAGAEIGLMKDEIIGSSKASKEFFDMANRSVSVLKNFFSPMVSGLKELGTEFAKDKLSKFIYKKLVPSGQAMAGTMTKSSKATTGFMGTLKGLFGRLFGVRTAATAASAGMTSTAGATAGAGAAMGGTAAAAGSLTLALAPLLIVIALVAAAIVAITAVLAVFTKGLSMNIETMENYRLASFRAAGSIRELTNATYDLSIATGLSNDVAVETIKATAEAGFAFNSLGEELRTTSGEILTGTEALNRMVEANGMFTHATGASAQSTAKLRKRMNAMGVEVDKQEALLGSLAGAAEKYGLTGSQLDEIMGGLTDQTILLTKVLDNTDYNEYAAGYISMAGAAKELGIEMGTVNKLMKEIAEGKGASTALAALGGNLSKFFDNDAANNLVATAEGAERVLDMAKNMKGVVRTEFLASFGGEKELELLRATAEKRKNMSAEELQAEKDLEAQRAKLTETYNNSLQTISQQMTKLFAPILAAIAKAIGPIVDDFTEFFNSMSSEELAGKITETLKGFVEGVRTVLSFMFSAIETFGTIWSYVEPIIPILVAIGTVIVGSLITPLLGFIGPIMTVVGAIGLIAAAFDPVVEAIMLVKDLLFGSSMFHIKESVDEDISPALEMMYNALDFLSSPLEGIKSLIGGIGDIFGGLTGMASDTLKSVSKMLGEDTLAGKTIGALSKAAGWVSGWFSDDEEVETAETSSAAKVSSEQAKSAYTVQVKDESDDFIRLLADIAVSSAMTEHILLEIAERQNGDTPATRETAERLKKLVEAQNTGGTNYPDSNSGFGERTNMWYS